MKTRLDDGLVISLLSLSFAYALFWAFIGIPLGAQNLTRIPHLYREIFTTAEISLSITPADILDLSPTPA